MSPCSANVQTNGGKNGVVEDPAVNEEDIAADNDIMWAGFRELFFSVCDTGICNGMKA